MYCQAAGVQADCFDNNENLRVVPELQKQNTWKRTSIMEKRSTCGLMAEDLCKRDEF